MNPSWKILFRILSRRVSPSKTGQHSNAENTENTTKIFRKKSNPKAHNRQIHQGENEGEKAKGRQRERSGYPQREAHQTHSRSLSRNLQARREKKPIFNILKEKNFQPRISYPAKVSFISEEKTKSFANKQVLRDFVTSTPALRELLKEAPHRKEQPVPATPKTYQMVKSINKMKNLHQLMDKTPS